MTAAAARQLRPEESVPKIYLQSANDTWLPRRDLLESNKYAREFVVELESDGTSTLRFGSGLHGATPDANAQFEATYRVGCGTSGNVGADSLSRIYTTVTGIVHVRNPLAATGGVDPESMESVRQFAPQAFRTQERAVTTGDWEHVAQLHPEVQRAAAEFRWTGSWHTVYLSVDRHQGLPVDDDTVFLESFHSHLEHYRLAGYDLEIRGPVFVALDITIHVCVKSGYFQSDIRRELLQLFGSGVLRDGTRGFFHPENLTFGTAVHMSRIYELCMSVAGVHRVEITKFQRYGKKSNQELQNGLIRMSKFEIARCDNDRNFPENGRFQVEAEGGL